LKRTYWPPFASAPRYAAAASCLRRAARRDAWSSLGPSGAACATVADSLRSAFPAWLSLRPGGADVGFGCAWPSVIRPAGRPPAAGLSHAATSYRRDCSPSRVRVRNNVLRDPHSSARCQAALWIPQGSDAGPISNIGAPAGKKHNRRTGASVNKPLTLWQHPKSTGTARWDERNSSLLDLLVCDENFLSQN
jgi:hypothetical protein